MPVNVVADARSDAMEKHHALRVNDSHCNVCEHKSHERWWPRQCTPVSRQRAVT
ncbi:predicted protein [Plenodomus lingam JN3]|uniref:Predicted protein n=1 Tax=Leptosphaeria maculans (strain JN3 / isolate v23.1.3 / race Av1-4-5-6-7-8) TaxID=985895 RepID=E4ZRR0_LEPMJ|nr:predicted protein [Plenodomus lingam JN3]CBX93907.1 predicted protein [Plenodomus lingam JN3]